MLLCMCVRCVALRCARARPDGRAAEPNKPPSTPGLPPFCTLTTPRFLYTLLHYCVWYYLGNSRWSIHQVMFSTFLLSFFSFLPYPFESCWLSGDVLV